MKDEDLFPLSNCNLVLSIVSFSLLFLVLLLLLSLSAHPSMGQRSEETFFLSKKHEQRPFFSRKKKPFFVLLFSRDEKEELSLDLLFAAPSLCVAFPFFFDTIDVAISNSLDFGLWTDRAGDPSFSLLPFAPFWRQERGKE